MKLYSSSLRTPQQAKRKPLMSSGKTPALVQGSQKQPARLFKPLYSHQQNLITRPNPQVSKTPTFSLFSSHSRLAPLIKSGKKRSIYTIKPLYNSTIVTKPRNDRSNSEFIINRDILEGPQFTYNQDSFIPTITQKRLIILNTLQKCIFLSTQDYQKRFGFLKTLLYQPRKSTKDKPVVIINFEGVLGEFRQFNKTLSLYLFSDTCITLKDLQQYYQLVLISGIDIHQLATILNLLTGSGVHFSGAYKICTSIEQQHAPANNRKSVWHQDYSRIYKDFQTSQEEVIVVCSLMTEVADFLQTKQLLLNEGRVKNQVKIARNPAVTKEYRWTPMTIVVPNISYAQTRGIGISNIGTLLKKLLSNRYIADLKNRVVHIKTSEVNEEYILQINTTSAHDLRRNFPKSLEYSQNSLPQIPETQYYVIVEGEKAHLDKIYEEPIQVSQISLMHYSKS